MNLLFVFHPYFWMRLWYEWKKEFNAGAAILLTLITVILMVPVVGLIIAIICFWPPILLWLLCFFAGIWIGRNKVYH